MFGSARARSLGGRRRRRGRTCRRDEGCVASAGGGGGDGGGRGGCCGGASCAVPRSGAMRPPAVLLPATHGNPTFTARTPRIAHPPLPPAPSPSTPRNAHRHPFLPGFLAAAFLGDAAPEAAALPA